MRKVTDKCGTGYVFSHMGYWQSGFFELATHSQYLTSTRGSSTLGGTSAGATTTEAATTRAVTTAAITTDGSQLVLSSTARISPTSARSYFLFLSILERWSDGAMAGWRGVTRWWSDGEALLRQGPRPDWGPDNPCKEH